MGFYIEVNVILGGYLRIYYCNFFAILIVVFEAEGSFGLLFKSSYLSFLPRLNINITSDITSKINEVGFGWNNWFEDLKENGL